MLMKRLGWAKWELLWGTRLGLLRQAICRERTRQVSVAEQRLTGAPRRPHAMLLSMRIRSTFSRCGLVLVWPGPERIPPGQRTDPVKVCSMLSACIPRSWYEDTPS